VFTPTLFFGACLGSLFGQALAVIWPGGAQMPQAYAVVGMGAFLAATTHAPIMAIIMLFELTLDYQIILPLMLACVVAHYTCLAFEPKSIYADSLRRKGAGVYRRLFASMRVSELMKQNPESVEENAPFRTIAQKFIAHRFNYLYVTDATGNFRGVISLHDVKGYLNEGELGELVTARDLVQETFPTITPEASLSEALESFANHDGERLPVTLGGPGGKLVGSISKTHLLLAIAERSKGVPETAASIDNGVRRS
jgi:CIC family chloride channel protein